MKNLAYESSLASYYYYRGHESHPIYLRRGSTIVSALTTILRATGPNEGAVTPENVEKSWHLCLRTFEQRDVRQAKYRWHFLNFNSIHISFVTRSLLLTSFFLVEVATSTQRRVSCLHYDEAFNTTYTAADDPLQGFSCACTRLRSCSDKLTISASPPAHSAQHTGHRLQQTELTLHSTQHTE